MVCCGADEAEVERRAANIGRKPDELRANGAAGTPDEVVARLQAFADIGAETVYLQVLDLDDLEHLELLAEDVLPRVLTTATSAARDQPGPAARLAGPAPRYACRRPGGHSRPGRAGRAARRGGRDDHHEPGGGGPDQ